jgi:hypothetical protein
MDAEERWAGNRSLTVAARYELLGLPSRDRQD